MILGDMQGGTDSENTYDLRNPHLNGSGQAFLPSPTRSADPMDIILAGPKILCRLRFEWFCLG